MQIIVLYLGRRLARFEALKARFDAGKPPPPARPARERVADDDDAPPERLFDFMPRERGWLFRTMEQEGAAAFWQLRDLLAEREMKALIAADPRVGRLLRPLWWMLSPKLGLPEVLRPPPRPPSPDAPAKPAVRRARPRSSPPRARLVRIDRVPGSRPPIPA